MNLAMLPMWLLSGVFFSADNFPQAMQPAIRILPLTALNDALRATMIDGAGVAGVIPQIATLAAGGSRASRWRFGSSAGAESRARPFVAGCARDVTIRFRRTSGSWARRDACAGVRWWDVSCWRHSCS